MYSARYKHALLQNNARGRVPGLWQDVYKITYMSMRIYLKIQMATDGKAIVISFKEDTS
jgi:hypothetical protein